MREVTRGDNGPPSQLISSVVRHFQRTENATVCQRARVARLLVAAVIGSRDQTKKGRLQEACLAALLLYISPLSLGLSNIPRGRVSIVGA